MAGPQKQFDTEAALANALAIFWRQGFELTSMQDLVNAMGINRASLYDTFGNKTELYKKALQHYIDKALADTRELLLNSSEPIPQRLMHFFRTMGEKNSGAKGSLGCFLNNTAVELGPHYPEVAELVRNTWGEMENIFQATLQQGIDNHELPPNLDTAAVAATINMTMQGVSVLSKVGIPDQHIGQIIATVLKLLRQ